MGVPSGCCVVMVVWLLLSESSRSSVLTVAGERPLLRTLKEAFLEFVRLLPAEKQTRAMGRRPSPLKDGPTIVPHVWKLSCSGPLTLGGSLVW